MKVMNVTVIPQNVTVKIETTKSIYTGGMLPEGLGDALDEISESWDCDTCVFYFYDVEVDSSDELATKAVAIIEKYL